jgi:hypothetical protein
LPAATRLVVQSAGGGRMTTRFTVETGDPVTPGA